MLKAKEETVSFALLYLFPVLVGDGVRNAEGRVCRLVRSLGCRKETWKLSASPHTTPSAGIPSYYAVCQTHSHQDGESASEWRLLWRERKIFEFEGWVSVMNWGRKGGQWRGRGFEGEC